MELYNILIVDDEEEIREGIVKKIDWQKYGFNIIGQAANGKEAIEIVENLKPDIVMTDIVMPFMNGLELGEYLYKKMPSVKVIIFSGSDDLEYAHKAIKINVVEYVLKPVTAEEIKETLTKLKSVLDDEYENKRNFEKLENHYLTSMPIIKEQVLTSLVEGRLTDNSYLQNYNLLETGENTYGYVSCLIYPENDFNTMQKEIFRDENKVLRNITIKQLLDESLKVSMNFVSFLYGDMVALVVSLRDKFQIYGLIEEMERQSEEVKRLYGIIITTGIGLICKEPTELRYSRKEAQTALDYRLLLGCGKVIYIGDVEPDSSIKLKFSGQDERELVSAIKMGSSEGIERVVEDIMVKLSHTFGEINQYRMYFMEIKISLLRLIQNYDLNIDLVFDRDGFHEDLFDEKSSLEDLKEWLLIKSKKISQLILKRRKKSSSILIEKAKEYIEENYNNCELTVDLICEKFHVSAAYFSTIFKKETGGTFISYLTERRLEKAVELLNTTDDKSYIIAEKVGYVEANYFSYVFKKKYGVAPSKFRNNRG